MGNFDFLKVLAAIAGLAATAGAGSASLAGFCQPISIYTYFTWYILVKRKYNCKIISRYVLWFSLKLIILSLKRFKNELRFLWKTDINEITINKAYRWICKAVSNKNCIWNWYIALLDVALFIFWSNEEASIWIRFYLSVYLLY